MSNPFDQPFTGYVPTAGSSYVPGGSGTMQYLCGLNTAAAMQQEQAYLQRQSHEMDIDYLERQVRYLQNEMHRANQAYQSLYQQALEMDATIINQNQYILDTQAQMANLQNELAEAQADAADSENSFEKMFDNYEALRIVLEKHNIPMPVRWKYNMETKTFYKG